MPVHKGVHPPSKASREEELGAVLPFSPGSRLERFPPGPGWNLNPNTHSSGVALKCAERWYESLHTTFASRRGIPHLPQSLQSGQGGLNSSLMKGLTATRSLLPPDGTKPDRISLTATADTRGSSRPTVVSEHPSWS